MKLLSIQPFSLYKNGGGSRLLRRLYEGRETDITSLFIEESPVIPRKGVIAEQIVYAYPLQKKWMKWKLRSLSSWLR